MKRARKSQREREREREGEERGRERERIFRSKNLFTKKYIIDRVSNTSTLVRLFIRHMKVGQI